MKLFHRKSKISAITPPGQEPPHVQMRIIRTHMAAQAGELGNIRHGIEQILDHLREGKADQ